MTGFPRVALATPILLLMGCSVFDPTVREGTLKVDNTPTINAASMIANPYDMQRGHGSTIADGQMAAAAVDRARSDSLKPLMSSADGAVASTSSGSVTGGIAPATQ
ncbi:hypothetical protein HN018_04445 [Lichenicola cladoniae]|uniref:Lipoprotein n=1 Tax=Lichenicola cladoniae TaxID=1484109 RepID=A0A6M8HM11_9PROT|nr:hypothetical protein [Lichenicola cladoniae]NPD69967.1 hypothetical protein [Acetobacteraceae bacterium]QKE89385.1 hypothetical protein HN018_04445 [Lichenicola cladoniae]